MNQIERATLKVQQKFWWTWIVLARVMEAFNKDYLLKIQEDRIQQFKTKITARKVQNFFRKWRKGVWKVEAFRGRTSFEDESQDEKLLFITGGEFAAKLPLEVLKAEKCRDSTLASM